MASDFAAYVAQGHDQYESLNFAIKSTNAGKTGAFCFFDTATDNVDECGADPALILGLMTGPYTSRTIYAGSLMPVICLTPGVILGLCSATTPVTAHLTRAYGIVKLASGNWALDISETVNTRCTVLRFDIPSGTYFVKMLAANLQLDSIVS